MKKEDKDWINIEERLPKDYEEVIYYALLDGQKIISIGHHVKGQWSHKFINNTNSQLQEKIIVTHWKPLPK